MKGFEQPNPIFQSVDQNFLKPHPSYLSIYGEESDVSDVINCTHLPFGRGRGLTMKKVLRHELMLSLSYNNSYGNAPWLSAGTLNRDDFSKVRVHRTGSNY